MYRIGEMVVYGEVGVCQVADITEKELNGRTVEYYTLEPCYQGFTIYAPVENCERQVRTVIEKDDAQALIEELPFMSVEKVQISSLRAQRELYESLLKAHSCEALCKLILIINDRKIAAEKAKRKVGAVDEKFLKKAEELLFGELAAALDISKNDISKMFRANLQKVH